MNLKNIKTSYYPMEKWHCDHPINMKFTLYEREYHTLMNFKYFYDIHNTEKEKEYFDEILMKDLEGDIRPEFKEAIMEVKRYMEENHLGEEMYYDPHFQPRLLLMLCLYIVCGVEMEICLNIVFNKVFYGISTVELKPKRVSEEYKWEYDIELTFFDYCSDLHDLLFKPLPPEVRGMTK